MFLSCLSIYIYLLNHLPLLLLSLHINISQCLIFILSFFSFPLSDFLSILLFSLYSFSSMLSLFIFSSSPYFTSFVFLYLHPSISHSLSSQTYHLSHSNSSPSTYYKFACLLLSHLFVPVLQPSFMLCLFFSLCKHIFVTRTDTHTSTHYLILSFF